MTEYTLGDPFSISFNVMKIKYREYDEQITSSKFLNPDDKVNVFINLESIFKNLSMIQDLEKKILLNKNFDNLIISNILNHCGHYKAFFKNNGLDTKVFVYNTKLNSNDYPQSKYNSDYRSYYKLKYLENPKFILLGDKLKNDILPQVYIFTQFIPNVYYISADNIEGSLVPMIISENDKSRKNLLITGDLYETQYSFYDNFLVSYIKNGIKGKGIFNTVEGFLKEFMKNTDDDSKKELINTFSNYNFYSTFLSSNGDRVRSIEGITGVGLKTLKKLIDDGISTNKINLTTKSASILSEIFPNEDDREEFINNYYCTNLDEGFNELSETDKISIINQIIDRVDINSLKSINGSRFIDNQINLEALTC